MIIVEIIGLGIVAFVTTNIDDLFILIVFFARCGLSIYQIVLGQYVGMALLLEVSLAGSLVALVIPHNLIGLIGLVPIAVGIKELLDLRKKDDENNDKARSAGVKILSEIKISRHIVMNYCRTRHFKPDIVKYLSRNMS